MLDFLGWVLTNLALAVPNLGRALLDPAAWLDWSDPEALMRFIYFGASVELFFVVLLACLVLTGVGLWRNGVLWATVRAIEGFGNAIGRLTAWVGLIMVLQQIVIIFSQRIFAQSELSFGLGAVVRFDMSWWSEELKLYNAMIVSLCVAYAFIQGAHVRVDLVYSGLSFRAKRVVDMAGALVFMIPTAILVWLYGWFFLWRSLVTPKVSASDRLDQLLLKARALRWNVETIGFSPNGFNAYFLFKILLLAFAALVFLQGLAIFFRAYLEWREGAESAGKHLDRDRPGDAPLPAAH